MTGPRGMTSPNTPAQELIEELRELLSQATARPWVAFDSAETRKSATLAIMKGRRPKNVPGRFTRWPEIIAWSGFDGSDVPLRYRRANLHLIVTAINALPTLLDLLLSNSIDLERLRALVHESLYHLRLDEAAKAYHERAEAALSTPTTDPRDAQP